MQGKDGTLRDAVSQLGIRSLTLEIGNPQRFHKSFIERALAGVYRTMCHLHMLPGSDADELTERVTRYHFAESAAFLGATSDAPAPSPSPTPSIAAAAAASSSSSSTTAAPSPSWAMHTSASRTSLQLPEDAHDEPVDLGDRLLHSTPLQDRDRRMRPIAPADPLSTNPAQWRDPVICSQSFWIFSRGGGVLYVVPTVYAWVRGNCWPSRTLTRAHVVNGWQVRRGDVIAEVRSIFGQVVQRYFAPCDGIIVGKSQNPVVRFQTAEHHRSPIH